VIFPTLLKAPCLDQDDTPLVQVLVADNPIRLFEECRTGEGTLLIGSDVETSLVDDTLHHLDACVDELNALDFHFLIRGEEGEGWEDVERG
jgi:hypothetical protein